MVDRVPSSSASRASIRTAAALAWTLVPPLLISALVHASDRDVGGLQGLSRTGMLLSVAIWALPIAALTFLLLWVRVRAGLLLFLATALVLAAVLGWGLFALGSTALTPVARLGSFLGATGLFLATFVLAVLPAGAIGWVGKPAAESS